MAQADRRRRTLLRRLAAAPALAFAHRLRATSASANAATAAAPIAADLWSDFRQRFVQADGRVVDDDGSTHSEGLGTALLASAVLGDRPTFDRVWAFAGRLRRPDGLFSWRVQAGGRVIDANNATDGDLYIAWALARAAPAFSAPELLAGAREIALAVRTYCLRNTRHGPLLVPGRFGFDRGSYVVANPSYWVFPAFDALAALEPRAGWRTVADTALTLLERARFGPHGLTGDWIEVDADVRPWRERPARFGYEAIRVPLFLYWGGHFAHPQLAAFRRHAAAPAFPTWVALDGGERAPQPAPPGFEAIARLARALPAVAPARLPALNASYYSSSLTLLAALANDERVGAEGVPAVAAAVRTVANAPEPADPLAPRP